MQIVLPNIPSHGAWFELLVLLFGVPALIFWLWNLTVPFVFHLAAITYWQAFRLVILVILFIGAALMVHL